MIKNRAENNLIRQTYKSDLRKLRELKGYSLSSVRDKTGVAKQTLHNWENGTIKNIGPKYSKEADKVAKLYGIDRNALNDLVTKSWLDFKKQTSKYQENLKTKTYIYELRIDNGKTLQNVANSIDSTIHRVLLFEDGVQKPSDEEYDKLATYFGINKKTLITRMEK